MNETKTDLSQTAQQSRALIYVVDDEPMLLELASVILEPRGYHVKTFRDPGLAFESYDAASPRPDLVITDFAMNGLNGMQLIGKFRKLNPAQKILLVSGTVGEDIFRNSLDKPNRFLAKPYQARQLTELVEALLAGK